MKYEFGRQLAALRRKKGMSQRDVARTLGISQALLSHYENGVREPGLSFLTGAAALFGCTIDTFFEFGGQEKEPSAERSDRIKKAVCELLTLLARDGDKNGLDYAQRTLETSIYMIAGHSRMFDTPTDNNAVLLSRCHADLCAAEAEFAQKGGASAPAADTKALSELLAAAGKRLDMNG